MKIIADMHTHTLVSGHAYCTLQENLRAAKEQGLLYMAATEHGPAMPGGPHLYYFGNVRVWPREFGGVRLIKGVEANVMSIDGELDLPQRYLQRLEYVAVGLHDECFSPGTQEENTQAIIAAIQNPYVDAIVHPGNPRFPINFLQVLLAAAQAGVLVEINNSSLVGSRKGSPERCREIAELAAKHDIAVVLGSDAHWSGQVGHLEQALAMATEAGIPTRNILNLDAKRIEDFLAEQQQKRKRIATY